MHEFSPDDFEDHLREATWTDAELVEQAELVRMAESVALWCEAELSGCKRLKIYRFPNMNPIKVPGTTPRA